VLGFQLPAPKSSGNETILGDSRKSTATKNRAQSVASSLFERQCRTATSTTARPSDAVAGASSCADFIACSLMLADHHTNTDVPRVPLVASAERELNASEAEVNSKPNVQMPFCTFERGACSAEPAPSQLLPPQDSSHSIPSPPQPLLHCALRLYRPRG
jgi:hypothetical protein